MRVPFRLDDFQVNTEKHCLFSMALPIARKKQMRVPFFRMMLKGTVNTENHGLFSMEAFLGNPPICEVHMRVFGRGASCTCNGHGLR